MYAVLRSPVGGLKVFLRGKTAIMLLKLAPVWKCLLNLNPLCALAGHRAPRSTCREYRALSCGAPILFYGDFPRGLAMICVCSSGLAGKVARTSCGSMTCFVCLARCC